MKFNVPPEALSQLSGFEQVGDERSLGMPYAVLEQDTVPLTMTLTPEGAMQATARPEFVAALGSATRWLMGAPPTLNQLADPKKTDPSGELLATPDRSTLRSYSNGNKDISRHLRYWRSKHDPSVDVLTFDHNASSTAASLCFETMHWLHHRLKTERQPDDIRLQAPRQFAKLTSQRTGYSAIIQEHLAAPPFDDLVFGNPRLPPEAQGGIEIVALTLVNSNLRRMIGDAGMRLIRANQTDMKHHILIDGPVLSRSANDGKLDFDGSVFTLVDMPPTYARRDIFAGWTTLKALNVSRLYRSAQ